ncbi:MAG: class I SAM-dependent methyltransferase [Thermodesulfovibrionales bacterium]|nr:class I SAM-dependent methyltransferase [Thermodesulfovibrionales bacterium]
MTNQRNSDIRTYPCPNCYLCGVQGRLLYQGLKDRLFGTPGEWNLKHCLNPECGLVWLDPMPCEEDIGKAYAVYYTHQEDSNDEQGNNLSIFLKLSLHRVYNLLLYATPFQHERKQRELMYLNEMTPGRLLEVGCGNGRRLAQMRALGWEVEGQEVDPKAAAHARNAYGVTVHLGTLENIYFPTDSFDAVIMNHVIEHVHSPVALLAECYRIMKPGGLLVAVTPNVESYGHKRFGACWRGLEPPRHLHLFSVGALMVCAKKAGFRSVGTWTTPVNAASIYLGSRDIQVSGKHKFGLKHQSLGKLAQAAGFKLKELFLSRWWSGIGEEIVLKVVK